MTTKTKCVICDTTDDAVNPTGLLDSLFFSKKGAKLGVCSNCVVDCYDIIKDDQVAKLFEGVEHYDTATTEKHDLIDLASLYPKDYYNMLNEDVIGQEEAKRQLSTAIYNHVTRVIYHDNIREEGGVVLDKSNVLLIGSSGTGKTLMAKTIAKKCGLPIVITDATSLTEAGYVGADISTILTSLLEETNGNVELAQNGIIFIDEIDKKRKRVSNNGKDPSGEGVQQGLLKLIEGTDVVVPISNKAKDAAKVTINTENILFIFSGAFVGLDSIVKGKTNIGLLDMTKEDDSKVKHEHLISYGMIPELVGRIPNIIKLKDLTEDELKDVLVKPKNSIVNQYKAMFALDGVQLNISDCVITDMAKKAIVEKTGARSLRHKVDDLLSDIVFNIDEISTAYEEVNVDMGYVTNKENLTVVKRVQHDCTEGELEATA